MTFRTALIILLASIVLSGLQGCGIKPDNLDPPPGAEDVQFPKTYPRSDR